MFDRGEIGGVLCVASETTEQIVDHRRLECLARVQTELVDSEQVTDVCARVAAALAGFSAGVRECDIYLEVATISYSLRPPGETTSPKSTSRRC